MVAIYTDGAGLEQMKAYAVDPRIEGFTTNPSLMKKAGITNYREFAKAVLGVIGGKPVSFEVLADDFQTMESQAREIAGWGENVWVKIPITNTEGRTSTALISKLSDAGLNLNVTAVLTRDQSFQALDFLKRTDILSIFVGRATDTGVSPMRVLAPALGYHSYRDQKARILWASAREVYNYYQAEEYGCDIITLTPDLIAKLELGGKDLAEYSLETVRQFHADGKGIAF